MAPLVKVGAFGRESRWYGISPDAGARQTLGRTSISAVGLEMKTDPPHDLLAHLLARSLQLNEDSRLAKEKAAVMKSLAETARTRAEKLVAEAERAQQRACELYLKQMATGKHRQSDGQAP